MKKTLDFNHIWFCASFDESGNITSMEEHDMREGGGVKIPEGVEPNIYFLTRVYNRTQFQPHRDKALEFVRNCGNV